MSVRVRPPAPTFHGLPSGLYCVTTSSGSPASGRYFRLENKLSLSERSNEMSTVNRTETSIGVSVRSRRVALPVEHGGWGLVLEPVVLGLVVVPSIGGIWLAVAAVACFLWRQPFKLAFGD